MASSSEDASVIELTDVTVKFPGTPQDEFALTSVSLRVKPGRILGIVGESGSGKSTVCMAIMGLTPLKTAISGSIRFRGVELRGRPDRFMRGLRGKEIGLVYQDPMAALNPVKTIGAQLREPIRLHLGLNRREADNRAVELLTRVGIADAREKLRSYPHEFSGGMRQRVVIAMAISCNPAVIIADEPTTALDVIVQEQVLDLLTSLTKDLGIALILVSHDLSVVAGMADTIAVMRRGEVVEAGDVVEIFEHPDHPYTRLLLESVRALEVGSEERDERRDAS